MATCRWCDQEMTQARSCTVDALHRGGERIEMVRWGDETGWRARTRCHDCGVAPGALHHPGCDIQQCAVCGRQMMTCGCRFDEDGPDEDEDDDVDEELDALVEAELLAAGDERVDPRGDDVGPAGA